MSNTQKQISQSLAAQGVKLSDLVKYHRKHRKSWGFIAEALDEATGILASRESLRKWFG